MVNAEKMLKFGVAPHLSAVSLAKTWIPLTVELSKITGQNIRFATAPNMTEFEKRIASGTYDLVYLDPYHYLIFNQSMGLCAIAKPRNTTPYGSITTVKNASMYVPMLKNTEMTSVAPYTFAVLKEMDKIMIDNIQDALVELYKQQKGKELLDKLGFKGGLIKAADQDWNDFRKIQLDIEAIK